MAVASQRAISVTFSGDVTAGIVAQAAENASSPGHIESKTLTTGANTITPPGTTSKACTIMMPTGNTVDLTLKGVAGDTGIVLHNTDPTSIALDSPSTTFVLNASSGVTVRLVWS